MPRTTKSCRLQEGDSKMKYEGKMKEMMLQAIVQGWKDREEREKYLQTLPQEEREAYLKEDEERLKLRREGKI